MLCIHIFAVKSTPAMEVSAAAASRVRFWMACSRSGITRCFFNRVLVAVASRRGVPMNFGIHDQSFACI